MKSDLMVGRKDPVVKKAWGDWIASYPWTCFVTITYDSPRRAYNPALVLKGGRWTHKTTGAVRSAMFVEPYQKIDGYHLHGLLYLPEWTDSLEPRMEALEKRLNRTFGDSCVLPAQPGKAAGYVTKYTGHLDVAGIEFDLLGDWKNP
jgi:hypothetical protein